MVTYIKALHPFSMVHTYTLKELVDGLNHPGNRGPMLVLLVLLPTLGGAGYMLGLQELLIAVFLSSCAGLYAMARLGASLNQTAPNVTYALSKPESEKTEKASQPAVPSSRQETVYDPNGSYLIALDDNIHRFQEACAEDGSLPAQGPHGEAPVTHHDASAQHSLF